MIVAAPIARLLLQGRATQVRLPVGRPQQLTGGQAVAARCPYRAGQVYAISRVSFDHYTVEGDPETYTVKNVIPAGPDDHVVVTQTSRATLGDLTLDDIKREGFTSRDAYLETWSRLYRGKTSDSVPVWVLRTRPNSDPIRLLTPTGRPTGRLDQHGEWHGSELDYTSSRTHALPAEPEAIDSTRLNPAWSETAAQRHADAKATTESLDELAAKAIAAGRGYAVEAARSRLQAALKDRRAA